jgi:uncharacterized protein (TIGR00290 family)
MMKPKAIFCWSGGKDSALALYKTIQVGKVQVVALMTTVNEEFHRISMHGVREELLERQAESIGLPLVKMFVKEGSNEEYEKNMEQVLSLYQKEGVTEVIFGDIFLEDLRAYREKNLEKVGMTAAFPLWKQNTSQLANDFMEAGFRTVLCCVNDAFLGESDAGKEFTREFLDSLPETVDPCGENGEFHTFCFDGPLFSKPVLFSKGEKVYKPLQLNDAEKQEKTKGFWFCDLIP